jgi:hypothetical protein
VERIGLPIDEDPFELIQMLRSLSDNFNKSKIEITKLRNSRDAMIEVKTLLEIELNKLRSENIEILGAVQDVAAKLQMQGLVIEEQTLKIKIQDQMLTEKDNEIVKLQAIISNMQNTNKNEGQIKYQDGDTILTNEFVKVVCDENVLRIGDDDSDSDGLEYDNDISDDEISYLKEERENYNRSNPGIVQNSIDFLLKL